VLKKKIWANFQRILELFTQKIVTKLSKIWSWDPGSEIRDRGSDIRDPEKTYPGSRGQKSPGSRIRNPGFPPHQATRLRTMPTIPLLATHLTF
jgi:hypothetical protein